MFILFGLKYYVDEYCTNVKLIQYLLTALKLLEPIFGKISCQLILKPFQVCTQFGYLSNSISTRIPISFTLNLIIRLLVVLIIALNPWILIISSKILSIINFLGTLVIVYITIKLSWIPGNYFKYNIQHAIYISVPLLILFLFLFITNSSIIPRMAFLLPIAQFIITDQGSLITSLLIGICMMMLQYISFGYLLSTTLLGYVLFTETLQYRYLIVGLIVSSSMDLIDNNLVSIAFILIYIITLYLSRKKCEKVN